MHLSIDTRKCDFSDLTNRNFSYIKTIKVAVSVGSATWQWQGHKPQDSFASAFYPFALCSSPQLCCKMSSLCLRTDTHWRLGKEGRARGCAGCSFSILSWKQKHSWNLPQWLLLRSPWKRLLAALPTFILLHFSITEPSFIWGVTVLS